jgi:hypothetical protein
MWLSCATALAVYGVPTCNRYGCNAGAEKR